MKERVAGIVPDSANSAVDMVTNNRMVDQLDGENLIIHRLIRNLIMKISRKKG